MPVINTIRKLFPQRVFESLEAEYDQNLCADIDFFSLVDKYAFGIQIKPITAKANFGNYSPSERMKTGFNEFTKKYRGKVFIIYSVDDEIANKEVVNQIAEDINRLKGFRG